MNLHRFDDPRHHAYDPDNLFIDHRKDRVGFGVGTSPSARVHITGGQAGVGLAGLKLDEGVLLTTPEKGVIEHDSGYLYFSPTDGTRYQLAYADSLTETELEVIRDHLGDEFMTDTDSVKWTHDDGNDTLEAAVDKTWLEEFIEDQMWLALQGAGSLSTDWTYDDPAGTIKVEVKDEYVQDMVASLLTDSSEVTWVYDDVSNTLSAFVEQEPIEDNVAGLIQDSSSVDWTYDDGAGTLTGDVIPEFIEDAVNTLIVDTSSVLWSYDDGLGTLGATVSSEYISDIVATLIIDSASVTWTYDDGLGTLQATATGAGLVAGSGSAGQIPKWTGTTTLGDSLLSESGALVGLAGDLYVTGLLGVGRQVVAANTYFEVAADPGVGVVRQQLIHTGAPNVGNVARMQFNLIADDTVDVERTAFRIDASFSEVSDSIRDSYVGFSTADNGTFLEVMSLQKSMVAIGTSVAAEQKLHIESAGSSTVLLRNTGSTETSLLFDAARTAEDEGLGGIYGYWSGNQVAALQFLAGPDTTPKDSGKIRLMVADTDGSLVEAFRIDQDIGWKLSGHGIIGATTPSANVRNTLIINNAFSSDGAAASLNVQGDLTITGVAGGLHNQGIWVGPRFDITGGAAVSSISSLVLAPPTITMTSGSLDLGTALRITGAPTQGTEKYAIWVDAGASRFDGQITIQPAPTGGVADATGDDLVIDNSGEAGVTILSGGGYSSRVYLGDLSDETAARLQYTPATTLLDLGTNVAGGEILLRAGTANAVMRGYEDQNAEFCGRVGIGMDPATYPRQLQVATEIVIDGVTPTLFLMENDTVDTNWKVLTAAGEFYVQMIDDAFGLVQTSIRVGSSGYVSLGGGTAPSYPLDVQGDARVKGDLIVDDVLTAGTFAPATLGVGTTTVPHGGIGAGIVAVDGLVSDAGGPHVQFTVSSDDYPVMQLLNWSHDNATILIDSYWNPGTAEWRSSVAGSNFMIRKNADVMSLNFATSASPGSVINWQSALQYGTDGYLHVGTGYVKGGASGGVGRLFLNYETQTGANTSDIILFTDNTSTAQSGAYNAKLKIFGGNSRTRHLEIYQEVDGESLIHNTFSEIHITTVNRDILLLPGTKFVGIGVDPPIGKLHVATDIEPGGISVQTTADDFILENSTHVGQTFWAPDNCLETIQFGNPSDATAAQIYWDYTNREFRISTTTSGGAEIKIRSGNNQLIGTFYGGAFVLDDNKAYDEGYNRLVIDGADGSNNDGPHTIWRTAGGNPLVQIRPYQHDNITMSFDAHYTNAWKSSDAGSNFLLIKQSDKLQLAHDSGVTVGNAPSWDHRFTYQASDGFIGINEQTPTEQLHINGNVRVETGTVWSDTVDKGIIPSGSPGITCDLDESNRFLCVLNTTSSRTIKMSGFKDGATCSVIVYFSGVDPSVCTLGFTCDAAEVIRWAGLGLDLDYNDTSSFMVVGFVCVTYSSAKTWLACPSYDFQ